MLTPILERFILSNKAIYKTHNHNFASYGVITVPKKKMIVITDIIYWPHINIHDNAADTYADVMQYYNETTMCLQSENKKTFYVFKNSLDITVLKPFTAATPLTELWASGDVFIQAKPPIKLDTFLANWDDVTIRIGRNISYANGYTGLNGSITTSNISDNSDEPYYPRGLKGNPLVGGQILTINQVRSGTGMEQVPVNLAKAAFQYLPYGIERSAVPANNNAVKEYAQGIHMDDGATFKGSAYQSVDKQPANASANAFPLVTFGYVEIFDLKAVEELKEKFTFNTEQ